MNALQRSALLSLGMAAQLVTTSAIATPITQYMQIVRTFQDENRIEVLGSGYIRVDVEPAFTAIREFAELRNFCDNNYDGNEELCDGVEDSIRVEADVLDGRFNMFGEVISGDDFQWGYHFDTYTEPGLSIFIAMGGFRWDESTYTDPYVYFASDGEDAAFGYEVNGQGPIGSPYCDDGICEFLTWSETRPPWAVDESETLPLALLTLIGLLGIRRKMPGRPLAN